MASLEAAFSEKTHPITEGFLTDNGISGGFSTFGPAQAQEFAFYKFCNSWVKGHGDYFAALNESQAEILDSPAANTGTFTKLSQNSRTRPWAGGVRTQVQQLLDRFSKN